MSLKKLLEYIKYTGNLRRHTLFTNVLTEIKSTQKTNELYILEYSLWNLWAFIISVIDFDSLAMSQNVILYSFANMFFFEPIYITGFFIHI